MGIANGRPLLDRPSRAPTNGRPGFPFGFWVLAGACQRHGVGGFSKSAITIISIIIIRGASASYCIAGRNTETYGVAMAPLVR